VVLLLIAVVAALTVPAAAAGRTVDVPRQASIMLEGENRGDLAGASVARAGDVNGDGRGDVIVGAPLADPRGRSDAGSAYVVFGSRKGGRVRLGALGRLGFRIDGAVTPPSTRHRGRGPLTSGAGSVVSGAGDVNGDGLRDVLVSGRFGSPFSTTAVFVVFGKRDNAPVDLAALGAGGFVVRAVGEAEVISGKPAGDVNGDGRADIALNVAVSGDEDAGTVFIVRGKANASPVFADIESPGAAGFRVSGGRSGLALGLTGAIAPAGDLNRDRRGDLLLGAPGAGRGSREFGRGSVFVLNAPRAESELVLRPGEDFGGFEVDGPRAREGFGFAVARLGRGFVAGAPGDPSRPLRGRGGAWIVRGRNARPIRLAGPRSGGPAGVAVDAPGDVAGDGGDDALVVTRGRRRGPAKALLFSARGQLLVTYTRLRNDREARIAAAGAGDVVGNRRNDLIFGSPGANKAFVLASR
jgi:FG-GAP repeat protein